MGRPKIMGGKDMTIVNPADLAPSLEMRSASNATCWEINVSCAWS